MRGYYATTIDFGGVCVRFYHFFAERSNAVLLLWTLFCYLCFMLLLLFFFFVCFFLGGGSVVVALFSRPFVCRESARTIPLSHLTNYIFFK